MNPLIRPAQAAAILATDRKTLWQLVDAGKIKPVMLTKHRRGWRFTAEAVNACIELCQSNHAASHGKSTSKSVVAELDELLGPAPRAANLRLASAQS